MVVRFRHGGKSDKKHVPHLICCEDKKQVAVMFWGCVSSRGEEALIPVLGIIDSVKYIDILKSSHTIPNMIFWEPYRNFSGR